MSILTKPLPDYITADGKQYKVRTDFRVWLQLDAIISNHTDTKEQITDIIINCFDSTKCSSLPPTLSGTLAGLMQFYSCNKPKPKDKGGNDSAKAKHILDLEADAPYLYAAFLAQYGVDLIDIPYLHWFKFSAMLGSLDDNSKLSKIMGYRQIDLSKIKDREQNRIYRRLKDAYALPDNRTEEEKEADMVDAISKMF